MLLLEIPTVVEKADQLDRALRIVVEMSHARMLETAYR
jgi:hypothetical protein